MKFAIVGAGWAGLSAAVTAHRLGHEVHVFEAAPTLGGRARSVHAPWATIDNGQHILLGAYTATLALMRELGLNPDDRFLRMPLNVVSADATIQLRAKPGLPTPLHIAVALATARGFSLREKWAALSAMMGLRNANWEVTPASTVQQWLHDTRQPARLQQVLWIPLCIATMNTPPEQACAQLFAHVLRDSLGARDRSASDMLIPRKTLTELWPAQVHRLATGNATVSNGGHATSGTGPALKIHHPHTVRHLRYATENTLMLDDVPHTYDAVLVCGNTPSTARLLSTLPETDGGCAFLADLNAFTHAPIATLTVEVEHPIRLPAPMLLLAEDRTRGQFGQWLFQGQGATGRLLHVVISDADSLLEYGREAAIRSMLEQLNEALRGKMPSVTRHALIVEKRATFLAVPGLKRPGNRTPWRGVWVAGDWTDTGYPAVLEGAVRSGRDAVLAMVSSS